MAAAFLIVPPVEFLTENPEVATPARRNEANAFIAARLAELGASPAPEREERFGGFRGTRIHGWPGSPSSALLHVTFVFPPRSPAAPRTRRDKDNVSGDVETPNDILRLTNLVDAESCIHRGGSWSPGPGAGRFRLPPDLMRSGGDLKAAASRALPSLSPVRVALEFPGPWGERLRRTHATYLGETMSAAGIVVTSALANIVCQWRPQGMALAPARQTFPARAHRILMGTLVSTTPNSDSWPMPQGRVTLHSGTFGERIQELVPSSNGASPVFELRDWAAALVEKLKPTLHDLNATSFRVLRREGRWVMIDRGRAFGLTIGMHLVGSRGERLHVIHFLPGEPEGDVAVALVRDEDEGSPLRSGDVVTFDPTLYPADAKAPQGKVP